MKRFFFITDSLGAPRNEDETINIDDTWCYQVAKDYMQDSEFFYSTKNGFDTDALISMLQKEFVLYKPDIIILQVGIVDCAPRVLSKRELSIVSHLGIISKILSKTIKKYYSKLSIVRDISYVDINRFENNLNRFCSQFNNSKIFAVAIAKPSRKYREKSPLISDRYSKYNEVLRKVFGNNLIDPYSLMDNEELERIYISDGYHLNAYGHKVVAKKATEYLREY
ncbi:SGNH/GDSL hydrolase family protein [Fusibacter paucivorans]|uniref:SGNH/GDSL hydrolase family protein n=1 Tax=Fusibacter paucivorans TaxID=76009 RepID=A0ABS5PUQ0_9FIRM|nr:SGNH/GDSL hydrolase family protein [Fusibacter paucivorans]MBS7528096.1 SGNH/GDSL hydrolase family protein [Fusibacter paucivorans]